MSKNKSFTAIVPQTDWCGSLLFRFNPDTGLQCFADGGWYQVSTNYGDGDHVQYSFQQPISIDGQGTVYLESASADSPHNANKVVITDADGKVPTSVLPDIEPVSWVDLT